MILNFSSLCCLSSVSSCSTFLLLSAVTVVRAIWSSVHVLYSFDTMIIFLSFFIYFSFFSMLFSSALWQHFLGEVSLPVVKLYARFHPFPSGFFVLKQMGCLFSYLCLHEIDFSEGRARGFQVGEHPPPVGFRVPRLPPQLQSLGSRSLACLRKDSASIAVFPGVPHSLYFARWCVCCESSLFC